MLKDYNKPKRDWTNKQWRDYCQIMIHSPHINKEDREYYQQKYDDLIDKNKM